MPLQKLQFRPGLNREGTNYSNEGGFYSGEKIRFRSGYPEKIGGWTRKTTNTFIGVARSLWSWVTLSGFVLTGVGTNQKYYIETGGGFNDITPISSTVTLGNDPFATTDTSKYVVVTHTAHGATEGTFVTYSGTSGGGVVNGVTLDGEFEIVTILSANTYAIIGAAVATATASGGGASVSAAYQINAGLSTFVGGTGWGAGGWSRGTWGSGTTLTVGNQLILWTQDNFGEDLAFAQRGGPIYYWDADTTTVPTPRGVMLSTAANAATKLTTTATFASGVTDITVPLIAVPYLVPGMVVTGTGIPAGTYITTAYGFSTTVPLSDTTTDIGSGNYTFSYAGRSTPSATYQIITSDVQRFAIALGANPYSATDFSTTFNPMLVRWSDQENIFDWASLATNQAGEQLLSHGSYIVCAQLTRQEILIWTDVALFSMQYLGPPFIWGFNLLMDNISVMSPRASLTVNNVTYWMGVDKFYTYTGRVETLPCTLRQYVFGDINQNQRWQIVCGSNEGYNEVWWLYPSAGSPVNDRYVIYNHLEHLWYSGTIFRTAWGDSALFDYPMAAMSVQNSYLSEAISDSATEIRLINASSFPSAGEVVIDAESITYTGVTGFLLTGCVRGANGTTAASHTQYTAVNYYIDNALLYHESSLDDEATGAAVAINSYIETSDFDIGDGHNYAFVWRMIPDVNFRSSTNDTANVTITLKPHRFPGSAYGTSVSSAVAISSTVTVDQYTEQVYPRLRGRQMALRVESSDLGVAWQLGAPRIDIRPDGRKT